MACAAHSAVETQNRANIVKKPADGGSEKISHAGRWMVRTCSELWRGGEHLQTAADINTIRQLYTFRILTVGVMLLLVKDRHRNHFNSSVTEVDHITFTTTTTCQHKPKMEKSTEIQQKQVQNSYYATQQYRVQSKKTLKHSNHTHSNPIITTSAIYNCSAVVKQIISFNLYTTQSHTTLLSSSLGV